MRALKFAPVTVVVLGLLAACAPKPVAPPPPPPPPKPVAVVIPPRPQPPGFAAPTQQLPARGLDGKFITPNLGLTGDRAFWQLKIGLNVAAIGCRGAMETTLVSAYNQIIKTHTRTIQSSEKKVIADLGKTSGTSGTAARDRLSTQLFNYFAQPPAQTAFCLRANEIAQVVATTPAAQLLTNAPAQLAELDAPFTQFYEAFAQWQIDAAAWDARYAPPPPVMAAPPPVTTGG